MTRGLTLCHIAFCRRGPYTEAVCDVHRKGPAMFEKKETIYKKKDRETWLAIRSLLKEQGFKGVSAGHYLQDSVMACGCGAKLDPRDFGAKGKADHDIYYIRVRLNDVQPALDLIRQNGLVAEVKSTEDLTRDAALKAEELRTD